MTEIRFYHLTKTPLEKALPQLLHKIAESGQNKVLLYIPDDERLSVVDKFIWTSGSQNFVAHGTLSDPMPEIQPVLLSSDLSSRENNPNILAVIDAVELDEINDFSIVVDMFDGTNDKQTQAARARWKTYSNRDDLSLAYWQQDDKGTWQQKS